MVMLADAPREGLFPAKRPMLAAALTEGDFEALFKRFPVLFAMRKIDGVRGLCFSQASSVAPAVYSRSLKMLPNRHLQQLYARKAFIGLDGEFIAGLTLDNASCHRTVSAVMAVEGTPDLSWIVFDYIRGCADRPYHDRLARLEFTKLQYSAMPGCGHIYFLPWFEVRNIAELALMEEQALTSGSEGLILRDPMAPYKHGRSTLAEGGMLKLKRFVDSEAVILDVIQLETNCNEQTVDERGFSKRSSMASGKMPMQKMGALLVRDIHSGVEFKIGAGFTDKQRRTFWTNRHTCLGKLVKYKHQPFGVKDKPRIPIFLGMRHEDDL